MPRFQKMQSAENGSKDKQRIFKTPKIFGDILGTM